MATRRFGSVALVTGFFLSLTRGIRDAISAAIDFERELIRIVQITGNAKSELRGLVGEVTNLATTFGVASSDILNTARTLSQAGFAAGDVTRALKVLSQTTLAPTFDNIQDTTEGAIALLNQFRKEAEATGDEIQFLEDSLGAINAISKNFAVESSDLITVIRRTGSVFESAGGSLNELLAVFTSVRATTRQSARRISTGLRTIFTRIRRPETINQLRTLGIELENTEGQFVGPLEAVKRLSVGLQGLDERDFRFVQIAEQLGGLRRIEQVIPLLRNFELSTEALTVAQEGANSVAEDAETAQQSLAVQISKVRQEFEALFRRLVDSEGFRGIVDGALSLARAFIKVADALIPLLPLLTTFAGIRLGRSFAGFTKGLLGRNKGGPIPRFAGGGMVPGVGNGDTVPALLTPGEFVIRKSSVESIGRENLAAMNNNRFQAGGQVGKFGAIGLLPFDTPDKPVSGKVTIGNAKDTGSKSLVGSLKRTVGAKQLFSNRNIKFAEIRDTIKNILGRGTITTSVNAQTFGDEDLATTIGNVVEDGLSDAVKNSATALSNKLGNAVTSSGNVTPGILNSIGAQAIEGNVFEGALTLLGAPFDRSATTTDPFDFPKGLGSGLGSVFKGLSNIPVEAKRTLNNSILKDIANRKATNYLTETIVDDPRWQQLIAKAKTGSKGPTKRAMGGTIPKFGSGGSPDDTVPALLTPGEFVINKKAAQKIGMNNLDRMNKTGVTGFARGGAVGVQRFQVGGDVREQIRTGAFDVDFDSIFSEFEAELDESTMALERLTKTADGEVATVNEVKTAREASVKQIKEDNAAKAASIDRAFGLAQSFAFLGGSVAALGSNLGIFSDEVAAGVTAGISQFSVLTGILGTVGQALTAFALKLSVSGNSAVASFGAGLLAVLGPLGLIATVAITLISVFGGMKESAQAAADSLRKQAQEEVIKPGTENLQNFFKGKGALDDVSGLIGATAGRQGPESSTARDAKELIQGRRRLIDSTEKAVKAQEAGDVEEAFKELRFGLSDVRSTAEELERLDRVRETLKAGISRAERINKNATIGGIDKEQVARAKVRLEALDKITDEARKGTNESFETIKKVINEQIGNIKEGIVAEVEAGATPEEAQAAFAGQLDELRNFSFDLAIFSKSSVNDVTQDFVRLDQTLLNLAESAERVRIAREKEVAAADKLRLALNAVADISTLISDTQAQVGIATGNTNARESRFEGFQNVGNIDRFNSELEANLAGLGPIGDELLQRSKTLAEGVKQLDADFFFRLSDSLNDTDINAFKNITGELPDALQSALDTIIQARRQDEKFVAELRTRSTQSGLVEDLISTVGGDLEAVNKAIVDANNEYLNSVRTLTTAIIESENKIRQLRTEGVALRRTRAEQAAGIRGERFGLSDRQQFRRDRQRAGGFAGRTPGSLGGQIGADRGRLEQLQQEANDLSKSAAARERAATEAQELANRIEVATDGLRSLADQSQYASDILNEIEFEQSKVEAFTQALDKFTFSTNQGRQDMQRNFTALNTVLASGNIESIPDQFRPVVGQLLEQFKNVELAPGLTGSEVRSELNIQTLERLLNRRLSDQEKERVRRDSSSQVEQLERLFNTVRAEEVAARKQLIDLEEQRRQGLLDRREQLQQQFFQNLEQILKDNLAPNRQPNNGNQLAGVIQVEGAVGFDGNAEKLLSDVGNKLDKLIQAQSPGNEPTLPDRITPS